MGTNKWSPEERVVIVAQIEEWIAEGGTLRAFCRQKGMPRWKTVYRWMADDPEVETHIARARDLGHEHIAEECMAIADESSRDTIETENGPKVNVEWVQRSKLRIDTRLKLLACWNPKRYGNKVALGGDATGVPIKVQAQSPDEPTDPRVIEETLNRLGEVVQELRDASTRPEP